jgi:anti-anti-sigma factor
MATRDLEVSLRERTGAAILDLVGDIDSRAEAKLQSAYDDAVRGSRTIVLNFTRADYINSSGIALIVALLANGRAQGVQITACGLSDHYRKIFEITRLADFMPIADDEDGALAGAGQGGHA